MLRNGAKVLATTSATELIPNDADGRGVSLLGAVASSGESHRVSRDTRSSGLDVGRLGYILNLPNSSGSVVKD